MNSVSEKSGVARRPIKGSAEDIHPPRPVEKAESDKGKRARRITFSLVVFLAGLLLVLVCGQYLLAGSSQPTTAAEIGEVYDHAIVLQAREGDNLETAALAVFPNTLVEARVREDDLSDEEKALELARYQAEWVRLARTLTGTTGTSLAPGEFFAVPARPDDPNAVSADWVSREIQDRTEAAAKADAGDS
jgi:hypothetical protein